MVYKMVVILYKISTNLWKCTSSLPVSRHFYSFIYCLLLCDCVVSGSAELKFMFVRPKFCDASFCIYEGHIDVEHEK